MNNILFILIVGGIGSILANVSNLIIIKNNPQDFVDIFKISLFILPIQFCIGIACSYYYSLGTQIINYSTLLIFNYGIGIILSILIQHYYLKKSFIFLDFLSISFIVIGILIYTLKFFKFS